MKIKLILLIAALAMPVLAQTNVVSSTTSTNVQTAGPAPAPAPGITVDSPGAALAAFVHLSVPSVSLPEAGLLLVIAARLVRKIVPDKWQGNKFFLALAHLGVEVNPTIEKLVAVAGQGTGSSRL